MLVAVLWAVVTVVVLVEGACVEALLAVEPL